MKQISLGIAREGTPDGYNVSVSTTTAQTSGVVGRNDAVIYSTVECFAVAGTNPTATVAKGTPIPALMPMRVSDLKPDDKIAFITATGTGTVYVRPGA